MSQPQTEAIRKTLAELHAELSAVSHPDPELRNLLLGALIELQESLGSDGLLPNLGKTGGKLENHGSLFARQPRVARPRVQKMLTVAADAFRPRPAASPGADADAGRNNLESEG